MTPSLKLTISSIYLFLFITAPHSIAQAQEMKPTKAEMYQDFDTLVKRLNTTSPHIAVKKDLWHYDVNRQLKKLRGTIDTITSQQSFALLIRRALFAAQDMHTSLLSDDDHYQEKSKAFNLYLPLSYQDGTYIVARSFLSGNDTVKAGSELVGVDGEKVNHYLRKHLSDEDYSYDLKRKEFYSNTFYKNAATIYQRNIRLQIRQRQRRLKINLPVAERLQFINPIRDTIHGVQVAYWADQQVLYIKLYLMEPSFIARFKRGIYQYRDRPIKRIIIDLRDNGGGSDTTWQSLYACLLPHPVSYDLQIDGYRPTALPKDYWNDIGSTLQDARKDTSSLLAKYHFYTWSKSRETLAPSDSSIRFRGKIVVLGENVYSSAGSAFVIPNASPEDSIYSVGRETGMFLGVGYSPVVYELPNSKIRFRIAPSIEVTHAGELTGLMHDYFEYTVPVTKEELINRDTFKGNTLGNYYLEHFDPFIKKAMSL